MTTMYKIRSTKTGLYSKGGMSPTFSKQGKVWKRRGDISSHFSQLMPYGRQVYRDHGVEVVELEVVEVDTTPGVQWIDAAQQRKDEKEAQHTARIVAWQEMHERQRLAELKKKYGE